MADHQTVQIEWRGDVPVSTRFQDPYYSLDDGCAEVDHVFLAGNGLPHRFRPGFHIAELGFGTGLNLFQALSLWRDSGQTGPLRYTSFEAYPLARPEMARALAARGVDPEDAFLGAWPTDRFISDSLDFTLVIGDARATLPRWVEAADAWFLDGFAPAQNPELWGDALMGAVAAHTNPSGTFATYTAAGAVRRALAAAGFVVERVPGFGRKRHMTRGRLHEPEANTDLAGL